MKTGPRQLGNLVNLKRSQPSSPDGTEMVQATPPKTSGQKAELATMLGTFLQIMKGYGKNEQNLDAMISAFEWALADYPHDDIKAAMGQWLRTSNEVPTPADIIAIIDPPAPALDKTVYLALKKKGTISLWEQDYITAFERGSVSAWKKG